MKFIQKINKGKHFSKPFWRPFRFKPQQFIFTDVSLDYILDEKSDQADINKLIGIAYAFRESRYSSKMIGWSYDPSDNEVNFFLYSHIPMLRNESNPTGVYKPHLISLKNERFPKIIITFNERTVCMDIHTNDGRIFRAEAGYAQPLFKGPYRMIFPYFGGNQRAPRKFKFTFYMK